MNIDKIVEESWKKAEMNYGMSYHANGKSANFNNIKYAFMDGIRKGYKQSRIDTLEQMKDKILNRKKITKTPTMFPYEFFLLFLDTELEKLK